MKQMLKLNGAVRRRRYFSDVLQVWLRVSLELTPKDVCGEAIFEWEKNVYILFTIIR